MGFRMYQEDEPFLRAKQRMVPVIENLSISVHVGEIVAVVGASGSGKTLLADAILGLYEPNATVCGRIWYDGEPQDAASLAGLRGRGISLVPQSVNNLDPLMKVGRQVEGFARTDVPLATRRTRRRELFARYGLGEDAAGLYPHQLSAAMARRVLLCCALMDDPRVIIADEPTPGLDLPLALAALADFRSFADEGNGVLLITHDIELALGVADRVACSATARWWRRRRSRTSRRRTRWRTRSAASCGMRCPNTTSWFRQLPSWLGKATRKEAPMLEARGITYAHPGAREPLYRDFDLAVGPGERVALSAPSGFGKTTLCRLLAGYERPQSGKILVTACRCRGAERARSS